MASFVLVHGAWHGGWCFERLVPLLEQAGHTVAAPDLPGMGGGEATLAGWGEFVADLCRAQAPPVILCGHSRGGIVISEAAERAPEAIAALVYITAFLVGSGRSVMEEVATHPRDADFEAAISVSPDQRSLLIDAGLARGVFYSRTAPGPAAAACGRLRAEPIAPMLTPLSASAERYGRIPRYYVECTEDRALPLAHQRAMYESEGCERVLTLNSDHSPFYSATEALAEMMINLAADIDAGAPTESGMGLR